MKLFPYVQFIILCQFSFIRLFRFFIPGPMPRAFRVSRFPPKNLALSRFPVIESKIPIVTLTSASFTSLSISLYSLFLPSVQPLANKLVSQQSMFVCLHNFVNSKRSVNLTLLRFRNTLSLLCYLNTWIEIDFRLTKFQRATAFPVNCL